MKYHCAYCRFPLPDSASVRRRARVSVSGRLYCSHDCRAAYQTEHKKKP